MSERTPYPCEHLDIIVEAPDGDTRVTVYWCYEGDEMAPTLYLVNGHATARDLIRLGRYLLAQEDGDINDGADPRRVRCNVGPNDAGEYEGPEAMLPEVPR